MVQGESGQGRRRNRKRAKGRGGGHHEVPPVNGVDRSGSESSSSDLGAIEVGCSGSGFNIQKTNWLKSLKMDMCHYDLAKLREAERKYYAQLAFTMKTQEAEAEDDVDLFASDEEEEPKAAPVKLAPKPVVKLTPKPAPVKKEPVPQKAAPEKIWTNKAECDDAEKKFQESLAQGGSAPEGLSAQIAKARQHIKNSLECVDGLVALAGGDDMNLTNKLNALEVENKQLKKVTEDLKSLVSRLEARVAKLEVSGGSPAKPSAAPAPAKEEEEDDDDVDLFGSDDDEEEDAEKARITAERLKAYHEKKAKKPTLIAKTNVLFDVKPWDDETDMDEMLKICKSIEQEGLVWGASKLVPVGYGISKLQLMCVVEDEKVSIEELSEKMAEFEDFVQSVDVAAMNKI